MIINRKFNYRGRPPLAVTKLWRRRNIAIENSINGVNISEGISTIEWLDKYGRTLTNNSTTCYQVTRAEAKQVAKFKRFHFD